jgi:hypothetical protein
MLGTFGELATIRVGAVDTQLAGIFSAPYQNGPLGGHEARDIDPSIAFDTDEFAATGATQGAAVTVRGTEYRIVGIEPDDGGMTKCSIREYPA